MTLETRIEAGGRRLLASPLWLGLLITAVLAAPTSSSRGSRCGSVSSPF